ncbi:PAS domain-containing protein [Roseivivax isoporae]|uniref:PAS domain-containing protein n=1 Tax=Roseivivax isoporae LMG 25204 TaxID=1449351 RepID=X7FA29_9RHOB|nr:PAS domain-containing protein [Roseivivax isoporae]ETX29528.1 hypothetical protein RISW2_23615 [Roseivivax isoporae LMG 25204]
MFGKDVRGSGVVSMSERERERRQAPLRMIETYWRALADQCGDVPFRDQVDPRGMQDALSHAFLAERIGRGIVRLRVSGTHLSDLMGMEAAGLPLSAFIAPPSRDALAEALERVFAGPETLRLDLAPERRLRNPPLAADLILLPLRSDTGRIDRALGGLVSHGQLGRAPRRFEVAHATHGRVAPQGLQLPALDAPRGHADTGVAPQRGLSEPARPFLHAPAAAGPVPYLRLVVSND